MSMLAAWLTARAAAAGLPPELQVMASLVESGVKNLTFGDADSVGFFKMRLSIWNSGAYAGFLENPELQIKWFIDRAIRVRELRIAAGDADSEKIPASLASGLPMSNVPPRRSADAISCGSKKRGR